MANLSSSKKMVRKITKRTERNKSLRTNVRTYIRRFEEAIASGETDEAQIAFNIVEPKLIKLAQQGIVHKKNASRKISRLSKKLKSLNVPLAGKTGTTNDNYDAWFIGFSSNLIIGVYIGYDNPKTLGKFETGSKVALPIFKDFIEKALYKEDFKEFQIPQNIYLTSLNYDTGAKATAGEKNTIIEALKLKDINNLDNNNLISTNGRDKIIKFRQFY